MGRMGERVQQKKMVIESGRSEYNCIVIIVMIVCYVFVLCFLEDFGSELSGTVGRPQSVSPFSCGAPNSIP